MTEVVNVTAPVPVAGVAADAESLAVASSPSPSPSPAALAARSSLVSHPSSMTEGNLPLDIVYKDLSWTVTIPNLDPATKSAEPTKTKLVLDKVSGQFRPGRLTAIMGASGAGKTTLLNVIAGYSKGGETTGDILVNGSTVSNIFMREISAFVHQADVIMPSQTVREAVTMAAYLRLPKSMPDSEKDNRIAEVMRWLNLVKVADNQIGSPEKKGISGGERRRVSVAMEMVRNPGIMFLDEPTSGLDSFTAYSVAHLLRSVAHAHRRTIVATIHQPSSEVFSLFDDLVLLSAGRIIYHGPAQGAMPYFATHLDYHIPRFTNPADFIFMNILNGEEKSGIGHIGHRKPKTLLPSGEAVKELDSTELGGVDDETVRKAHAAAEAAREKRIVDMWNDPTAREGNVGFTETRIALDKAIATSSASTRELPNRADMEHDSASFSTQLHYLCLRSQNDVVRNPFKMRGRLFQSLFRALFAGLCWLQVGYGQGSIQGRSGVLFFTCTSGLMSTTMSSIAMFIPEKEVFQREYAARMYTLPAFFISKYAVELPMRLGMPFVMALISYWMIGLQNTAGHFFTFAANIMVLDVVGANLGILFATVFPSLPIALAASPMVLMPLMLFSGYFLNADSIGWWFRWLSYISPLKYAFAVMALNEYPGLTFTCSDDDDCTYHTGEDVIDYLSLDTPPTLAQAEGILVSLAVFVLALAYYALYRTAKKM